MKSLPLRPKYPIEQYVIAFEFPGTLTSQPIVTVELVTGIDPNVVDFAGWLFTTDNVVSILVTGGVPGCVYLVSCDGIVGTDEFTRSGVIAVKDTIAIAPPGFTNDEDVDDGLPTLPFSRNVSSPPYPQIYYDQAIIGLAPNAGDMRTLLKESMVEPDNVDMGFVPDGGELFTATPPELEPDAGEFGFVPVGGELKAPPVGNVKDQADFGFTPSGGTLYAAPQGRFTDNTEFGFAPNGGSLS